MSALEPLRKQLRGDLITPASAAYDSARQLWNGMLDKRPAGIARCSGVADVVACVQYAAEHDILLAVRGGGHNVAGLASCPADHESMRQGIVQSAYKAPTAVVSGSPPSRFLLRATRFGGQVALRGQASV